LSILKAVKRFLELEGPEEEQTEETPSIIQTETEPAAAEAAEDGENEEEIVAVITAAIAASLGKPLLDFRVVSFKRRGDWNKQAYL